jgi:hypothetical protein
VAGSQSILQRIATSFLTGSAGRFTAFVIDVSVATVRYWRRRLAGDKAPW